MIEFEKWRAKPENFLVVQLSLENIKEVAAWLGAQEVTTRVVYGQPTKVTFGGNDLGEINARVGDYIFLSEDGQFFKVTEDILFQRYEKLVRSIDDRNIASA